MTTREAVRIIREVMTSGRAITESDLRLCAQTHAQACAAVMEKAFYCARLLKENKRTEAVQLARRHPDLKDDYEQADFDTVTQWWLFCESSNLPRCHLVIPDVIKTVINTVYSANPEYDGLMRRHRLLALSRGDWKERLRTVRQLAALDGNAGVWKRQIAELEKACLEKMYQDTLQADQQADLETLRALDEFLGGSPWQDPQAAILRNVILERMAPHKKKAAADQYKKLAGGMARAFSHMDVEEMAGLLERWDKTGREEGVVPPDDLIEETRNARQWIEDILKSRAEAAAYQQDCARLDHYVGEPGGSLGELDELAAKVLAFDLGIPELLAVRYNTKRAELERKARQRFALKLTAIITALVLIATGSGLLINWQMEQQLIARWQTTIGMALEQGNYPAAAEMFAEAQGRPGLWNAPEIQSLHQQYLALQETEKARVMELEQCMAQMNRGEYTTYLFERADRLARTSQEKGAIEVHRQVFVKREDELQRQWNEEYKKKLGELELEFARLGDRAAGKENEMIRLAEECRERANGLRASPKVYSHIALRAEGIGKVCDTIVQEARISREKRALLDKISGSYGDPAAARALLEDYATRYPNDERTGDFSRSLFTYGAAGALARWNGVCEVIGGNLSMNDPAQVRNAWQQVREFCDSDNGKAIPGYDTILQYQAYLARIKESFIGERCAYYDEIATILESPVISAANTFTMFNKTYYIPQSTTLESIAGNKKMGDKTVALDYFYTAAGGLRNVTVSYTDLRNSFAAAAQNELCRSIINTLDGAGGADGYETLIALARITAANTASDPVLLASLLRLFNGYITRCAPIPSDTIKRISDKIDQVNLDVAWMDPDSAEAIAARPGARRAVDYAKPLYDKALLEMDAGLNVMLKAIQPVMPVGIVLGHQPPVLNPAQVSNGMEIWSIEADGQGRFVLVVAGAVVDNKAVMKKEGQIPDGVLLFVRKKP